MDWWTSLAASIALLWIFCFIDGKRKNSFVGDQEAFQEPKVDCIGLLEPIFCWVKKKYFLEEMMIKNL